MFIIKRINLNNFTTNYYTYIRGMFCGCSDELKKKIETKFKNITKEAFE